MISVKKIVCVFLTLIVFCMVFGVSAEDEWKCPECGREGNTGNFCGNCGYPAPQTQDEPPQTQEKTMKTPAAGDTAFFGRYEQDNDPANGPEPIEWIVMDVRDGKALLISRYGLAAKPYNTEFVDATWETCTLRAWLNDDFLNQAFTAEEQAAIPATSVDNSFAQGYYAEWDTDGGNNTEDRIFLLSYAEANMYLGSNPKDNLDWLVAPTEYAFRHGAFTNTEGYVTAEGEPTWWWWLRSPGSSQDNAASVAYNGVVTDLSNIDEVVLIRPVFRLDLEAGAPVGWHIEAPETPEGPAAGETVTFGRYEQDNDPGNGPEPIEWIVLDTRDGKTLLLSRYGLDVKPYNTQDAGVTWETCSLRTWLNGDFLNEAFSAEEQAAILVTEVENTFAQGNYMEWRTDAGNNTQDLVFLLSFAETSKYLAPYRGDSMKWRTAPTAYALAGGAATERDAFTAEGGLSCCWWLRSPGESQASAVFVSCYGGALSIEVYGETIAIRPAIWVDTKSAGLAP